MFGYIKPDKNNLLVKDLALYKSVYCGLCSVIKREISFILPFTLSYDFVFLAMVRASLQEEKAVIKKGRCKYNPMKKCVFCVCDNATLFTARSALILTALKLEDDISDKDTPFYKRLFIKPFHSHLTRKIKKLTKKHPEYNELVKTIRQKLCSLTELEKSREDRLDEGCEIFGEIMSDISTFGLEGESCVLAKELGESVGRYIYLIDAIDDIERDAKKGSYNPLLIKYGSSDAAKSKFKELDVAVAMFAKRAVIATDFLKSSDYTRIIENILNLGMGAEAYRIMTRNGEKND
ncbi:MAG: hypothetical protein E7613_06190 [Ruminococcaceae bacterium]|nr:hypothetical protein [Oscillospiraceae bacterium]